jgi:uncharacterized membrane protein YagU involved in acid resistance
MKITVVNRKNIWSGIIGGLIAGVVFGFILVRIGVLSSVGRMMGLTDPLSSFIIHLIFSAILGLIFALVLCKGCTTFFNSAIWGIVYGIIWWFLGPLTLCPWMSGSPVSWSAGAVSHAFPMLIGHLVYGLVLGVSYFWMRNRK